MKKSVKSSEENKMVEAERPKCEKQVQNVKSSEENKIFFHWVSLFGAKNLSLI